MPRENLTHPSRLLQQDQRIKFGAIQAVVAMAECALSDLFTLLQSMKHREFDSDPNEKIINRAFTLAWSIVDQADLLRQIVESEKDRIKIKEKRDFFESSNEIRVIRNWMRHIPQKIKEYRSKKNPMPPILGAISFVYIRKNHSDGQIWAKLISSEKFEYDIVVIWNTAAERSAKFEGSEVDFESFNSPIGHICLQAYGTLVPLEKIVHSMSKFADALNASVQAFVSTSINEMSNEDAQNIDRRQLFETIGTMRIQAFKP